MAQNTSKWLETAPKDSKSLKPLKKGQKVPKGDKCKKKIKKK